MDKEIDILVVPDEQSVVVVPTTEHSVVFTPEELESVTVQEERSVVVPESDVFVVSVGEQGPPGAKGDKGDQGDPGVGGVTDHGALTGLTDDDHTGYLLLAGRAGGQSMRGGTGVAENLNIYANTTGTSGQINLYARETSALPVAQFKASGNTLWGTMINNQDSGTVNAVYHSLRGFGAYYEVLAHGTLNDSYIRIDHSSATGLPWSMGIDASASLETLGLWHNDMPGTTPVWTISGATHVVNFTNTPTVGGSTWRVPSFTVSGLPSATTAAGVIYVSDETGGPTLAFSDGTNWRRVQDRAIVT